MKQEEIQKAFEGRWRIKGQNIDKYMDLMLIEYRIDYVKKLCRDFFEAGISLGQSDTTGLPPKVIRAGIPNSIDMRAKRFFLTFYTSDNIQKYGNQMLQDFYKYWSEPNPSNTKMRFELQKTWDVNRRLARWARNNFNRYDRQQPSIDEQRRDKLASILTD